METGKKNEPYSAVEDEENVIMETNHNSQQAVILALALSGKLETGVRYYSLGTRSYNIKKCFITMSLNLGALQLKSFLSSTYVQGIRIPSF